MHISANIIRFPTPAPAQLSRQDVTKQEPDNVVAFPARDETPIFDANSTERGRIFAAHRIVSRIADQLDALGTL